MNLYKAILLFFTLTLISCKCKKDTALSNHMNNNNQQIQFEPEVLLEGTHGGYDTAKFLVIKEEMELRKVYSFLNRIRKPGIPLPTIDFENEMVLALFMGKKNTGGYTLSIDTINNLTEKVEVIIQEKHPEQFATMVITNPFYICKIKKTDKEIIFKKNE